MNGKVPQQQHFISCLSKMMFFRTKALHDAVIHACVGVEVIPQGPLEGHYMANSHVEMVVREGKRQWRTIRFSRKIHKCTYRR